MTEDSRRKKEDRIQRQKDFEFGIRNDGAGISEFGIWKAEKIVYGRVHRAGA